jgi:hypothetical protein
MPVVIPDEILQLDGLSEREALLIKRKIPIHRPTGEDLMEDLETLKQLRES